VAEEETPAGFPIAGSVYPIPPLDTLTMDESQIMYDYSGLTLEEFAPAHPESPSDVQSIYEDGVLEKARNPAFKRSLLHIALRRGEPDMPDSEVRGHVGRANALDTALALLSRQPSEDPTPGSPNEPSSNDDSKPPSRPSDSGSPSPNGSDEPASLPAHTGTGESATSSPESGHMTLVT
jgi:hypothetical protein